MIKYAVEHYYDVIEEIKPILLEHWREVAWHKDKIPYAPDWEKYEAMADAGILHIVTARDDGKLIGYYVSMIMPGLHYKHTTFGTNDVLFVDPEYRGGRTAYGMFKFAFKALKEAGCDIVFLHMKTDQPFERLCEALGMEKQEYLFSKYLGD